MRRFFFVLILFVGSNYGEELISVDELADLVRKFTLNSSTTEESARFQDAVEIFKSLGTTTKALDGRADTRNTLQCIFCRAVGAAAFDTINDGATDNELEDTLTTLCTLFGIQSYKVCRGALRLNIPILAHIVRTTPEATPQTFCGLALQSGNPTVCPVEDPRFDWTVQLPAPNAEIPTPTTPDVQYKVAIVGDVHIDPTYDPNGVANCDEPICCRMGQNPEISYRYEFEIDDELLDKALVGIDGEISLNLSVVPKIRQSKEATPTRFPMTKNVQIPGYWGDYRNCDTPIWAFDDAMDQIATHTDIDAIYYIGDNIDHGVWETSYELINQSNQYVFEKIINTFGDDMVVLPTIGNHEAQPTNQFAPASITEPNLSTRWLYDSLADKWGSFLPAEALAHFRETGDYSVLLKPGLRVISLNNNIAYRMNWWLVYDPQEPKQHLDWLIEELLLAEQAGEKVHILTHIPPGANDFTLAWTREYNRIINRFSSTIAAEFNGHIHSDEFRVFYDEDKNPVNIAWGAGAATAFNDYNLNYKLATFDSNTFQPTSIETYIYNLTEANLTPERRPHWFLLYEMKHRFNLPDLSASSIDNLIHSMVTDNTMYLDLYSAYSSKLSDTKWMNCNNQCKIDTLCKTVVTVLYQNEKCEELRTLHEEVGQ